MRRLAVIVMLSVPVSTVAASGPAPAAGAMSVSRAANSAPGRAMDPSPNDVKRASARYAKLRAKLQRALAAIKARYRALRQQAKQCLASGNPACLEQLQAAMAAYETFLETESARISSWLTAIAKIFQNIH